MSRGREILVLERSSMPAAWLPSSGALPLSWADVCAALQSSVVWRWLVREKAERAPAWKQPIPYVLLRDAAGNFAAYPRRGTEQRLHGLWSLGIGGHVERSDDAGALPATLMACARRELTEELPDCQAYLRFCGLINEEVTEVGTVHWGLVFTAEVRECPQGGEELAGLQWLPPGQVKTLELELWSRLALRLMMDVA